MTLREAAQQALEALNTLKIALRVGMPEYGAEDQDELLETATTSLRAALESDDTEMLLRQHRFEIGRLRAALAEPDLNHCPNCGGIADNGHDRGIPPNPYWCSKCTAEPAEPVAFPEGYEPHELPADYTGRLWIEGQVRRLHDLAAPTPRKPLTAAQAGALWKFGMSPLDFARAIEAAHGITGDSK